MRENFEAIFDTGTTMIVGDPSGISKFYEKLPGYGVDWLPEYDGDGSYTSTSSHGCATNVFDFLSIYR